MYPVLGELLEQNLSKKRHGLLRGFTRNKPRKPVYLAKTTAAMGTKNYIASPESGATTEAMSRIGSIIFV